MALQHCHCFGGQKKEDARVVVVESELGGMGQTAGDFAVPRTCTSVATVCSERFREILASRWHICQVEQAAGVTTETWHR